MENFPIYCRINVGHHRDEYVKHISPYECVMAQIWRDGYAKIDWSCDSKQRLTTHEWDYLKEDYTRCTEAEYLAFLDRAYQLIKSK